MIRENFRRFAERATLALLRRVAPRATDTFAPQALYIAGSPTVDRELDRLAENGVLTVRQGPFKGLKLPRQSSGTALAAKMLGTYEAQLAPWVETIVASRPATLVNVGCSDGYYLNGFAMRLPGTRVVGYDISTKARDEAAKVAQLNRVTVEIRSEATAASLDADLANGGVLVIDVEGAEVGLLDPTASPSLQRTTILVELHDLIEPGATPLLLSRFRDSHDVVLFDQQPVLPSGFDHLPEILRLALVCEHRGGAQQWALLVPMR